MKFTSTEVTLGRHLTHVHTIKINTVKRFFKAQKSFESEYTEVFPGKKFAFVIGILSEGHRINPPNGKFYKWIKYKISDSQPWTVSTLYWRWS